MTSALGVAAILAQGATLALVFHGALRVDPASLRRARDDPRMFLRTFAAVWVLIPVLTLGVVWLLQVPGVSATTLVLMAVCPGMPVVLEKVHEVKGAVSTALVALVLTAATAPLVIPVLIRALSLIFPAELTVRPRDLMAVLLPTVFIPVAAGLVIRARFSWLAAPLATVTGALFPILLGIDAVLVLTKGLSLLGHVPKRAFVAAALVTLGDAVVGSWAGRPHPREQRTLAMASALGNPALALAVVGETHGGFESEALIATYLIIRAISLAPLQRWLKRQGGRPG